MKDHLWREEDESAGEVLHANLRHRALFKFLNFKSILSNFDYSMCGSIFFKQFLKRMFFCNC